MNDPHPMQPLVRDDDGVIRFRKNKVVRFLIDWSSGRGMSMNDLAIIPFDDDDMAQFAQLIGYSVSGFSELPYVSEELVRLADKAADEMPIKGSTS